MQDDHLIAAESGSLCLLIQYSQLCANGHLGQHLIATRHGRAESFTSLKLSRSTNRDRDPRIVSGVAREFVFEPFEQQTASGKSGQWVVVRRMHQLRDHAAQALNLRTRPYRQGAVASGAGMRFLP